MALRQHRRAVGVFSNRHDTEVALRELRESGYPMDRVSVITRDADRQDDIAGADVRGDIRERTEGNKADEGATTGAIAGGALGGLTGLLVGLGTLAIPGIGPIMLAGATATAIATTLAGGAIGAVTGGLLGALIGLGIPEERARVYHDRVSRGHYLILVEGTDDEIGRAEAILRNRGIEEWGVYDHPDGERPVGRHHRAIGAFSNRPEAEAALHELRDAGFPMSQISLVARDYDRHHHLPGIHVRDRFDNHHYGFPEDRFHVFHNRFNRGDYLVIVDGTEDDIRRAQPILSRHRIQDWGIFDAPDIDRDRASHGAEGNRAAYAAPSTPRSALVHNKRAIGVFPHRRDAEAAIQDLRDAGFPMSQISLVGKNTNAEGHVGNVADRTKTDEGAKAGAATGAALGGLGGLLVGLGALAIPGIGPVLAGGALATALATAATGGAIGAAAGGLTGALVGLGIPDDRARHYNDRVARGDYLVMVDGTEDEIRRAEAILRRHKIQDWDIFDVRDDDRHRTHHDTPSTHRPGVGGRYRGVGVFPNRRTAEAALHDLRNASFPMDRVSVVGKDADRHDRIAGVEMSDRATGNKADEGAKTGAATGAALGGLGGLLVGLGALAIPGVGPVIAGGALATALATTAAGGAIGAAAGGLTGALVGLGIPEERARFYNDRVNRGDYLVMLDGTQDELYGAQAILNRHGIQEWGIYDTGDVAAGRTHDRTHDRTPDVARERTDYATPVTHHREPGRHYRAVGVFPHRRDAETALRDLRDSGFSMNQISLVGKHTSGEPRIGDVSDRTMTDEGAKGGAATGAALGGLGGLLVGLGALAIPGIGPVLAGGALATALATAATGGAIGAAAGGLTGALVGLGIPDDRARFYNDRVNRGDYLVMVDGTEDEIRRADTILSRDGIQDWGIFDAPSGERARTDYGTTATPTAARHVIEPDHTPGVSTTHRDRNVVSEEPEVIIIDHRDQTL